MAWEDGALAEYVDRAGMKSQGECEFLPKRPLCADKGSYKPVCPGF